MESNTLAQFYQILSYVMFALAAASFAFAIFCFFKFNIVKIINDLTGRTAKKSIEKRRSENEKDGNKSHRPSSKAKQRGTVTSKMRESQKLNKKTAAAKSQSNEKIDKLQMSGDSTEVLQGEKISDAAIPVSSNIGEATTVLQSTATTVLNKDMASETEALPSKLETIQSIVLIHTDEVLIHTDETISDNT